MAKVEKISTNGFQITLDFEELRQVYMILGAQSEAALSAIQKVVLKGYQKELFADMPAITELNISERLYGQIQDVLKVAIQAKLPAKPIDSRVELVKQIRMHTDCGLKEAMSAADYLLNNGFIKVK